MEGNSTTKTSLTKNLNKVNFSSSFTLNVDANANIKNILDVESYLYDLKLDTNAGKAQLTGKLGVKVLYIDTDNISNTLTDSQNISESITDASITADSYINASKYSIANTVSNNDGTVKILCDINIAPIMYLSVALPSIDSNFENLIVKKSEISVCALNSVVDSSFNYSVNLETKDDISKILMYKAFFAPESVFSQQGKAVVEGKIFSTLVYETNGEDSEIKEIADSFNLKTSLDLPVDEGDILDLSFIVDPSQENITTENDEDGNTITINHHILVSGATIKNVSIDVLDDMYSTENELELTSTKRDYCNLVECSRFNENISGEIAIEDNESAIEKIVSNLNIVPEITNFYIKDGSLIVEGIISSHAVYLDEFKEYKQKQTELPFIINTKIKMEKLDCVNTDISILDCRTKAKRGTNIELDYVVKISITTYQKQSRDILDNFTLGKALDFSAYDYQIFLAKAGETMWELCKRIKISPDEIVKLNQSLPLIMEGGEKVIIKR